MERAPAKLPPPSMSPQAKLHAGILLHFLSPQGPSALTAAGPCRRRRCAAEQRLPLVFDELRRQAAQKMAQEAAGSNDPGDSDRP